MPRPPNLTGLEFDPLRQPPVPVPEGDFWVFGYGSLMWRPDFPYRESRSARLYGYHRCLCVWSARYRGTPASPGLVLGLDSGGSCVGSAFLVEKGAEEEAAAALRHRELVTGVYIPRIKPIRFLDGSRTEALVFIVRRDHRQYSGRLQPEEAASVVARARGDAGPNLDYVRNTIEHLDRIGIRDTCLHRLNRFLE